MTLIVEAVKALAVLAVMVYLVRKRWQLGHVLFISALLYGLLHQMGPVKIAALAYGAFLSQANLITLTALFFINILENIMRVSGSQSRLVAGLKNISGDPRFTIVALPAIVGMLPSPGGARFSAPLVEEAAKGLEVSPEKAAVINYFYRHIWEYSLPLYPGNLLAVALLQIPYSRFSLAMLPYMFVTVLIGLIYFRGITVLPAEKKPARSPDDWRQVLEGLASIVLVMVLVLAIKLHVLISLLIVNTLMYVYYYSKKQSPSFVPMLKEALAPRLFYMVFAAIFFRDTLIQSGSIDQLLGYMQASSLNPLFVIYFITFAMGLLSGMVFPAVTVGFPLMMPLTGPDNFMSLSTMTFICAFLGNMLSPIHLCLIMSVEHFRADFAKTWRMLILPLILIFLFALAYSSVL